MTNVNRSDNTYSGINSFSGTLNIPASTIEDVDINIGVPVIQAVKLEHQFGVPAELFGPATTVAAVTQWIYILHGTTGEIVNFEAAIAVVADDAGRTITVDLQKSTGGGAFATVLSGTIGFTNGSSARTAVAGTISSADLVDGDILEIIVTVAGGSGNQATGLTVNTILRENPT